jgi:hypothetical protein
VTGQAGVGGSKETHNKLHPSQLVVRHSQIVIQPRLFLGCRLGTVQDNNAAAAVKCHLSQSDSLRVGFLPPLTSSHTVLEGNRKRDSYKIFYSDLNAAVTKSDIFPPTHRSRVDYP